MFQRLEIVRHLDSTEIDRRYRNCHDAREKTHWLVLRRLTSLEVPSPDAVAQEIG